MLLAGGAVSLLVLAGCSAATTPEAATTAPARQGSGGDQQGRGVSGLIASAQDGLLQVQGDGEQTAVRYTADTTVRKTAATDATAIAVGDCIVASTPEDAGTATTITVTAAADDGTCTTGLGGGPDVGMPTDAPSGMPTDAPSGGPQGGGVPSGAPGGVAPTGGPGGQGGFGTFTIGAVTAVSGSTITVETTDRDGGTSTADVVVGSATTVTATVDATAADIAVGLCVTAMGTADDSGGYDATALTLSDPDDNGDCTSGPGGFGGRPGGDQGDPDGQGGGSDG